MCLAGMQPPPRPPSPLPPAGRAAGERTRPVSLPTCYSHRSVEMTQGHPVKSHGSDTLTQGVRTGSSCWAAGRALGWTWFCFSPQCPTPPLSWAHVLTYCLYALVGRGDKQTAGVFPLCPPISGSLGSAENPPPPCVSPPQDSVQIGTFLMALQLEWSPSFQLLSGLFPVLGIKGSGCKRKAETEAWHPRGRCRSALRGAWCLCRDGP